MSVLYLLSLLLIPLVLSQPDLCRNPKLDSIAYISGNMIWFFTSGGYYWYIKENDFPPGPPTGKLPDGFARGDAAFYTDWIKVCGSPVARNTRNRVLTNDQLVVLVEKGEAGNKIIEFDTRQKKWSKSHDLGQDHLIGRSNIQDLNAEIDAIFSIRDSEVYVVQKQKYAAVDLKVLCTDPNEWSKQFGAQNVDSLGNSLNVPFDAIAVKDDDMYYFIGSAFWKSKVDKFKSRDGKIVISKGSKQNVSSNFFKFPKCPENVANPTQGSDPQLPKPDNQVTDPDPVPGVGNNENGEEPATNPNAKPSTEPSGGGGVFMIILIVVILVVVALVIAIVVFLMTRKSSADQSPKKVPAQSVKSKAAKPSKQLPSKASPAVSSKK